jgi:hypothetical protein
VVSSNEVPKGLTALEYSRHILEFELCWPAKSNIELIADCITAISKGKGLPLDKAYKYLARAICLAKEQSIKPDRMFFLNGDYMHIRPVVDDVYSREEKRREAVAEHGCNDGWVYAGSGVVRCQKCVRAK